MNVPNTGSVTIAVADDNQIFREGLCHIINSFGKFSIILREDDCSRLLDRFSQLPAPPNLCIIDISMPESYQILKELKAKWPSVKVLILSMLSSELSIIRTIKIGANGFLLKGCSPKELENALDSIIENGSYYPDDIHDQYEASKDSVLLKLSYREMEMLSLCCMEMTMKDIAERMGISVRTADNYRDALYEKLQVKNRIGLVLFALKIGMMPTDSN